MNATDFASWINSPQGQSVVGNTAGYGMADADFATRFPQMVQARGQYQGMLNNLLGTQTPQSMAQGNTLMNAGAAVLPSASTAISSGQGLANKAPGIINQGASLAGQAQDFASRARTIGQPDISLGQNLVSGNMPIDPMVQQELMRSGLTSAAGALGGAAGLMGTAGQAAVGRQLGLGAQNWINQQRTMGQQLQQTGMGLTTGMTGAAGTLAGAGSGLINAGSGVASAGSGLMNAGSGILGASTGAMTGGQGIINNATQNANQTMGLASTMFQPRQFGLQGSDLANINVANVTGQNNLTQYLYAAQLQNNQTNAQIAGANAGAAAQSAGNLISGGTSVASSAAAIGVAIAISCFLARECYGETDPRFYQFRHYLMNLAPHFIRRFYLRYAQSFSSFIHSRPLIKGFVRNILDIVSNNVPYAPV